MPVLATLSDDLQEPVSRLGDAGAAYQYVYNVIQADRLRSIYRTHVDGNIDGNAPFPSSRPDRTNLNFRQGAAIITNFKIPYYDLLCEVPLLFETQTSFGNSEERSDWSQIISEEFHRLVTGWEDWDETMQQCITQMLVHNIGHLYFENEFDWRPEPAMMNEILVADQSPCRLSKLEAVVIRKGYLTTELMSFIAREKYARSVGWNTRAVKEAVRDAYSSGSVPPDRQDSYEWFQQKRRNADLYFGTFECQRVWAAHCAVREYGEGGISNNLIRTDKQTKDYLFQKRRAYSEMSELICPFFYEIKMDGLWHSGRGVGTDIFAYCQVFNKLRCREVDAAFVASSVLVQAKDGNAARQAQMMTLDNLKILPEGVTFIEHAIGQNIAATVDVRSDMEAGMMTNIGGLMKVPGASNPRQGQKHAILEMQQAAQIGRGKINQFYAYLDRLGRVMFKKAGSPDLRAHHPGGAAALDFQKRCFKRGVPREAFTEMDFVRAYRSAGAGSAVNAIMALETMKEIVPSLNEPGKAAWMRIYISRLLGTRTADMLVGEVKTGDKRTDQDWQASVENKMLRQGADGRDLIAEDQNHVIHARSHIGDMAMHLRENESTAAQQQLSIEDLQPLYTHLEAGGQHAFDHLERFKGDPIRKGDYKELHDQWLQISRMQDAVSHNLREMMQERAKAQQEQAAQQQAQQINPDILKLMPFDSVPESVRQQIEHVAGVQRAPGEVSPIEEKLQNQRTSLALKAAKLRQQGVISDVELSQSIEKHRHDMQQPVTNGK